MLNEQKQKAVLNYLIQNPMVLRAYNKEISNVHLFRNELLELCYRILWEAFREYQCVPAKEEMAEIFCDVHIDNPILKDAGVKYINEVYEMQSTEITRGFIKKELVEYNLKNLFDDPELRDPTTIPDVTSKLTYLKTAAERIHLLNALEENIGTRPFQNISDRIQMYQDMYGGTPIQTGIIRLDATLSRHNDGGGLRPGDLAIIMGFTGGGKTTVALNIALNIVKNTNAVVVYYILDNLEAEIIERIDARITEVDFNEDKEMNSFARTIQHAVSGYRGELVLKTVRPRSKTIWDIESHLDAVELQLGKKVDVVIIDPGDYVKGNTKYNEVRHDLEQLYVDFRGMAQQRKTRVIATTQGNRKSLSASTITLDNLSEAYSKAWPSSLFITINQSFEDRTNNTARLVVVKNTKGPSNIVIPCFLKFSNMTLKDDMTMEAISLIAGGNRDRADNYRPCTTTRG
jgi:energy-coupling factor transporter ATP-binding protein EcfA2